ncbi:hypothetical protein [Thermococcus sp. JCM 11816]|uniref:hypothetical protein n=1 Tax=Thermococcus sp. (strain JCM 11816 / KS-1) TaxID=1295125 RepID=UPI0006D29BAC
MKRLLLMGLLLTAIFNPTTQGALASSAYGALTIEGGDNLTVEVRGVGVFNTPITLVLPVGGNYTVSAEGQVKLEAKVFVNASKLVRVEFSTVEPDELVEGNLTILGVKVTYDWWKHYPKIQLSPKPWDSKGGMWRSVESLLLHRQTSADDPRRRWRHNRKAHDQ